MVSHSLSPRSALMRTGTDSRGRRRPARTHAPGLGLLTIVLMAATLIATPSFGTTHRHDDVQIEHGERSRAHGPGGFEHAHGIGIPHSHRPAGQAPSSDDGPDSLNLVESAYSAPRPAGYAALAHVGKCNSPVAIPGSPGDRIPTDDPATRMRARDTRAHLCRPDADLATPDRGPPLA